MRRVCTSQERRFAENFHRFLAAEGIEAVFEALPAEAGDPESYQVWIVQEDDFERAAQWYEQYAADPGDPRFTTSTQELVLEWMPSRKKTAPKSEHIHMRPRSERATWMTSLVLFVCCTLFFTTLFMEIGENLGPMKGHRTDINPINTVLMFDFPAKWQLQNQVFRTYSDEELRRAQQLPAEGIELVDRWLRTPVWEGYYPRVVYRLRTGEPKPDPEPNMFERIKAGELWRIVTPAFLHGSILHILFNMLWLTVLGRQLETRLGVGRYLLFICFTAAFSNVSQYLMSGPAFLGYSGVVLAMLAFIATRRKQAPWEGYLLQPGTLLFVSGFVMLFVIMEFVSFAGEVTGGSAPVRGGMANTAHLAGALSGWLAARSGLFNAS